MIVGYKLIRDSDGAEIQSWGGTWGQCPGIPNPLILPNGDHVHAPALGESYGGHTLVAWDMERVITALDVKAEAQRRIIALVGATNLTSCMIRQHNAQMRATSLTNKRARGLTLTAEELAEEQGYLVLETAILGIRQASNAIEAMTPIPADFAANEHWE